RGFRNFALFGLNDQPNYVDRIGPAFAEALMGRGMECAIYEPADGATSPQRKPACSADLERWLRGLPKPVGMLAWDSEHGRRVADACLGSGLQVPEDVGVIGGGEHGPPGGSARPPPGVGAASPGRGG